MHFDEALLKPFCLQMWAWVMNNWHITSIFIEYRYSLKSLCIRKWAHWSTNTDYLLWFIIICPMQNEQYCICFLQESLHMHYIIMLMPERSEYETPALPSRHCWVLGECLSSSLYRGWLYYVKKDKTIALF